MSIRSTARIDVKVLARTPIPWVTTAVLVLITGLLTYVHRLPVDQTPMQGLEQLYRSLAGVFAVMLPLIILLVGFAAIAGDRDNHRLSLYLSQPNSRMDLFLGKALSRFLVVLVGLVATVIVIGAATYLNFDVFSVAVVVGLLGLTLLYAAAFTSITIGISAASRSRERSLSNAIFVYFVLVVLKLIPVIRMSEVVAVLHSDVLGRPENVDLYNAIEYLNPVTAYRKSLNLVLSEDSAVRPFLDSARNIGGETLRDARVSDTVQIPEPDLPVYLTDEFAIGILALWVVIPLLLGYWGFERAELM